MNPLRAIVLGPLGPPYGGPEVMTRTLIDALAGRTDIEFIHIDTQVSPTLADKGGRRQLRKSLRGAGHAVRLLRAIVRFRPELVYLPLTNSPSFLGFIRDAGTIAIARATGRRVVVRLHGGYYYYVHTRGWRRRLVAAILGKVDLAMVQGSRLRSVFDGLIPPERIAVVPNGVPDEPFAEARRRLSRPRQPLRCLFVGLLCKGKGFHDVIAAMRTVPQAEFVFMGEWSSEADRQEALARLKADGTADRARFPGVLSGDAKYDCFVSSDVFAFPSYYVYEGHAVSSVEALAAGLPIVCTDHGALSESVRDGWNGFFVPPHDPDAVAARLVTLLSNDALRAEMARRSRELYEQRFTASRFVDTWSRALRLPVSR